MKADVKSSTKPGPQLTPQNSVDSKTGVNTVTTTPGVTNTNNYEAYEDQLTASEMENVTTVFRYFETGLREATILPKVMKENI